MDNDIYPRDLCNGYGVHCDGCANCKPERATEARPSASAAPGIDTPTLRLLLADYRRSEALHEQHSRLDAVIAHIDAAIAAAREEAQETIARRDATIERLRTEIGRTIRILRGYETGQLRARLAAPEGWLPDLSRVTPEMRKRLDNMMTEVAATGKSIDVLWQLLGEPQAKAPQQPHGGPIAAGRFSMVGQEWRQMPRGVYEGTVILYHADGWPEAPK